MYGICRMPLLFACYWVSFTNGVFSYASPNSRLNDKPGEGVGPDRGIHSREPQGARFHPESAAAG